jgi:hypothetical protein
VLPWPGGFVYEQANDEPAAGSTSRGHAIRHSHQAKPPLGRRYGADPAASSSAVACQCSGNRAAPIFAIMIGVHPFWIVAA